ncbi:hypothetical protein L6164_036306 [Bauhinia variegata]|uniref:Uncharacterized protein n=1 Tax=Bauhinia variegata TaxID=167791 RepID=A0ACB9KGP3_BAUVA|nr:hypothetical protein L6164_036306 [Bauhinia variegata]
MVMDHSDFALDNGSQNKFDASFFANLRSERGVLQSDQVLWNDASTKTIVQRFLGSQRFTWIIIQCPIWKVHGEDE